MLMKANKNFLVGFKVFFGLLGLSAVVTEMVVTIGRGTFRPENFFKLQEYFGKKPSPEIS